MNLKTLASEETKRNIVQTAISILGTEGYPALTVGKLSQQAGVSKGALYHHFESLDQVRLSALEALIEEVVVVKDPAQFDSLSVYLEDMGREHFDSLERKTTPMKAIFAYMAQGMFDKEAGRQLRDMTESSLEQCGNSFKYFMPELPEEQLEALISIMDAYFIGMFSQWFLDFDSSKCRESWNVLSEMIITFIGAREAGR